MLHYEHKLPKIASIKGNEQTFLPVNRVSPFDSERAAAVPLRACEAVDGHLFVPCLGVLLVLKELKQAEKHENRAEVSRKDVSIREESDFFFWLSQVLLYLFQ